MLQPIGARNGISGENFSPPHSTSSTTSSSSNFSSYSTLPPAPLGFNEGSMGTKDFTGKRTTGMNWIGWKIQRDRKLEMYIFAPNALALQVGLSRDWQGCLHSSGQQHKCAEAFNKAVYPQTSSSEPAIIALHYLT